MDHRPGIGADDMGTEQAIGLRIRQQLREPARVPVAARPAVGGKGKAAGLVLDTGGLELLLRLADARNLGRGVDDGRHGIVVDPRVSPRDALDAAHAVEGRIVGARRSGNPVTDGVKAWASGLDSRPNGNTALLIKGDQMSRA